MNLDYKEGRGDYYLAAGRREERRDRFQREIDHWNRTGKCLRHFSIDIPPMFCEQCGKPWSQVLDGREGRKRRREADR